MRASESLPQTGVAMKKMSKEEGESTPFLLCTKSKFFYKLGDLHMGRSSSLFSINDVQQIPCIKIGVRGTRLQFVQKKILQLLCVLGTRELGAGEEKGEEKERKGIGTNFPSLFKMGRILLFITLS